jgi:hypothetical protein
VEDVMTERTVSITQEVEEAMACIAFAEEGEPCPIGGDEPAWHEKTTVSVEETMACTAFAEEGEPCPLDSEATRN